jgi:hypothetical protein
MVLYGTYLDDLVDFLVLPLVGFGHLLATRGHFVVSLFRGSVAVRGSVEVWVAF